MLKKSIYAILFVLIFSFGVFAQKGKSVQTKNDPTKAVRAALDTLLDGIRKSDIDKFMSVYLKSDKTLFFNNNGSATIGWQNMYDSREKLFSNTKNVTIDITGLRIELLGKDSAYVSYKWKQSQDYDGKFETANGRTTLVFKLIGKDWKAIHVHTSPDTTKPDRTYLDSERDMKDNQ